MLTEVEEVKIMWKEYSEELYDGCTQDKVWKSRQMYKTMTWDLPFFTVNFKKSFGGTKE